MAWPATPHAPPGVRCRQRYQHHDEDSGNEFHEARTCLNCISGTLCKRERYHDIVGVPTISITATHAFQQILDSFGAETLTQLQDRLPCYEEQFV